MAKNNKHQNSILGFIETILFYMPHPLQVYIAFTNSIIIIKNCMCASTELYVYYTKLYVKNIDHFHKMQFDNGCEWPSVHCSQRVIHSDNTICIVITGTDTIWHLWFWKNQKQTVCMLLYIKYSKYRYIKLHSSVPYNIITNRSNCFSAIMWVPQFRL